MKPCLCACGTLLRRSRSLPLCREATAKLRAVTREMVRTMGVHEYQVAYSRLLSSEPAVRAVVGGAS